ncbi:hypothetical protein E2C01_082213 [Portunus trituberculatus]|uniref:Uncharacterized protein n=1 Tax=Portunus trituberculatus TaxID=210409 RepID=A0A5B7ITX8_PORTR|nr:hypothetical protein [Portunus trituberculatus]
MAQEDRLSLRPPPTRCKLFILGPLFTTQYRRAQMQDVPIMPRGPESRLYGGAKPALDRRFRGEFGAGDPLLAAQTGAGTSLQRPTYCREAMRTLRDLPGAMPHAG